MKRFYLPLFLVFLFIILSACTDVEQSPDVTAIILKNSSDCMGDEINPIAQSIGEDYNETTYEDIMTWFCNGAEFEDILTALETHTITETPVEELLQSLADGLTWEEIWILEGLVDF